MQDRREDDQANWARLVGTLDTQRMRREVTALVERWNDVRGRERQAVLQVCSPFGKPFQVMLRLDAVIEGLELLSVDNAGALLTVEGDLAWMQSTDPRYALTQDERGRQVSEVTVRAQRLRLADAYEQPGCDIHLAGTVLTAPRLLRHPDRPVDIVVTTLRVEVTHTRPGSRARITEPSNVAIAIAADHADAPKLLRPNNQVVIEGMLERHVVRLRDPQTMRAVAALDAEWSEQRSRLGVGQGPGADSERRYARRRRQLQEEARLRVMAGYVELCEGRALTLEEGQALREQLSARSHQERAARRNGRTQATTSFQQPPSDDSEEPDAHASAS